MAEPRPRRKRGNTQWGVIAVGVVVLVVAGLLVWSVIGKKSSASRYVTQQPTRGTLTVTVSGSGNVVSQSQASVNPSISGKVKDLSVKLGGHVKKGDVLFVIDNAALDQNVTQAKSSWQNAKASATKAAQSELQADISLRTGVTQALQQLEQAKAQVRSARSSLAKAQGQTPIDANAVSAAQHSLNAAQDGLDTAQSNYDHACSLQRKGHTAAAQSYAAAVTAQSAAYQSYRQSIQNADQRTVTAPIDGYITTLSINNGDQLGTSSTSSSGGSSARSSSSGGGASSSSSSGSSASAPIVISDLSALQAQVQIAETDRPKVKLGQKVELTFDAVPNLTITGLVTQIDAVGTSSSGVVTFNVTISMDVQDKRLSPGMTASASIVTEVRTDVLLVPNAAVKTDSSGASYVQVTSTANGNDPQNVTVSTGAAGDTQTEITSGLKGTENVVVQSITPGSTSTGGGGGGTTRGFGGFGGGGAGRFGG